jgi:hypothetical protein
MILISSQSERLLFSESGVVPQTGSTATPRRAAVADGGRAHTRPVPSRQRALLTTGAMRPS